MNRLSTTDVIEWYYDYKGSLYGFLLLNTDGEALIRDLKSHLSELGITSLKEGKSFKPASNNRQYKTYVSVAKATGGRPSLIELKTAIRRGSPNFHFDASSTEIREYFNSLQDAIEEKGKTIAARDDRIKALQQLSAELEATNHSLRDELNRERQSLLEERLVDDKTLTQLVEEENARHKQSEDLLEGRYKNEIQSITDHSATEINNLTLQLLQAHEARERALDDLIKAKEKSRILQDGSGSKGHIELTETELTRMLFVLLPRISFDEDTIQFMLDQIDNRQPVFRCLRQLNDGETLPFKRFESADGWMEVDKRLSDGHSSSVRVYYKKDKSSGKIMVYVSGKEYQSITPQALSKLG